MSSNEGVEGYVSELKTTVRECNMCGCLVPGGPTRCKRCSEDVEHAVFTLQKAGEKTSVLDDWSDSDANALIELANELTALGYRNVNQNPTKAAIIMLKSLQARLESLNELTRRILDEHGISTQEDESPESRLRKITEILHLVNLRDVQRVLEKKEGAGK